MKRWIGHIINTFTRYRPLVVKANGTRFGINWYGIYFLIKSQIYKIRRLIRYKIIFKLIFKIISLDRKQFSYLTVDLKEIKPSSMFDSVFSSNYNWNALIKNISRYGMLTPIQVCICNEFDNKTNKTYRYCVKDGNHRITILKKYYQPDYKVKIKIHDEDLNLDKNVN